MATFLPISFTRVRVAPAFALSPAPASRRACSETQSICGCCWMKTSWTGVIFEDVFVMQATMFQPVGGMDRIPAAFHKRLHAKIRLGARVVEITKLPQGVRIVYLERGAGEPVAITADYAIVTILCRSSPESRVTSPLRSSRRSPELPMTVRSRSPGSRAVSGRPRITSTAASRSSRVRRIWSGIRATASRLRKGYCWPATTPEMMRGASARCLYPTNTLEHAMH